MTNTQSPAPGVAAELTGHAIIEAALKKAALCNLNDAPFPMTGEVAHAFMQGLATAYQHALEMIPPPPLPAQVQEADVTDEQADEIANACYRNLKPTGYNGGMGGQTWDRALVRAALASRTPAPGMAGGVVFKGPNKWTDEEVADGHCGIRWITLEGVQGRPTSHDVMDYLQQRGEAAYCSCDKCKAFFAAPHPSPAPQAAGALTPDELADKCEAWLQAGGASNIVDAYEAGYRESERTTAITASGRDAS